MGARRVLGRSGRVSGLGLGWASWDAGRGLGACRAGQGRGQRNRGGQCARLYMEHETVRQSGVVIMHNRRTDFL